MHIIIVGCGKVGRTLAEQLQEEETDLTLIDMNADIINSLTEDIDAMGIVGNGASINTLTIARVRNPIYSKEIGFIKERLGLSMIMNPELAAAQEISRLLRFPAAIKIDPFSKGRVELLKFKVLPEFGLRARILWQSLAEIIWYTMGILFLSLQLLRILPFSLRK